MHGDVCHSPCGPSVTALRQSAAVVGAGGSTTALRIRARFWGVVCPQAGSCQEAPYTSRALQTKQPRLTGSSHGSLCK